MKKVRLICPFKIVQRLCISDFSHLMNFNVKQFNLKTNYPIVSCADFWTCLLVVFRWTVALSVF